VICTFYSYKGGVGRSMALANVADILARRGLRVLMIDFDLEAPGLEQFFPINQPGVRRNLGLLDLVVSFKRSMSVAGGEDDAEFRRLKSFVVPVYRTLPSGGSLDLMPAGQREGTDQLARYAYTLRTLDWQDFYANWAGEAFFEWLRKALNPGLYDVVLVDSRTGVTELGGICAYQLADTIVLFCASNHQNLEGTRAVVADILSPGVAARRGDRPLQAIVLPARIEQHDDALVAFRERFSAAFDEYTPEPLRRAGMSFWNLAIPYEPRYAFEERVITDPARADERRSMVAAFQGVVNALALLADSGAKLAGLRSEPTAKEPAPPPPLGSLVEPHYDVTLRFADYDVYISYNSADREAVLQVAERLKRAGLRIFVDAWSLVPGQPWQEALEQGLHHSRSCAVFVGPFGIGPWQGKELEGILAEAGTARAGFRIIPVLLPGAAVMEVPSFLKDRMWVDLRRGLDDAVAFQRLLAGIQDAASSSATQPAVEYTNPYLGLRAFSEADEPLFFGRDRLLAELVHKVKKSPLVAVVGPSGSGKTSLVYAGLLPSLRRGAVPGSERWIVVTLKPGPHPMEALTMALSAPVGAQASSASIGEMREVLANDPAALDAAVQFVLAHSSPSEHLFLVVDQLEELFTLSLDKGEVRVFVAAILDAVTKARTTRAILLLRADFYTNTAMYPELAAALSANQVYVSPMSSEELREVIERPAQAAGGSFEPGLVDRLVQDVQGESGALPLLQFTLVELWERRRGGWLTHQAYDEIGGLSGVLRWKADEVFSRLSPDQQLVARQVILRLIQLDEGRNPTRRRALLAEMVPATGDPAVLYGTIRELVAARLVVAGTDDTGQATVELAHEALIRYWPGLQVWLEEDIGALLFYRQLSEAAAAWNQAGGDKSYLFVGTRLQAAETWANDHGDQLTALDQAFLKTSIANARSQKTEEHAFGALALLVFALITVIAIWSVTAAEDPLFSLLIFLLGALPLLLILSHAARRRRGSGAPMPK
jgi:energy-coupling factor transporter ATP-binding protein EcfA2